MKKRKDNERLATIIVQLRTNEELLDLVYKLTRLSKSQLEKLSGVLDTVL